jgi:hypothetical protein
MKLYVNISMQWTLVKHDDTAAPQRNTTTTYYPRLNISVLFKNLSQDEIGRPFLTQSAIAQALDTITPGLNDYLTLVNIQQDMLARKQPDTWRAQETKLKYKLDDENELMDHLGHPRFPEASLSAIYEILRPNAEHLDTVLQRVGQAQGQIKHFMAKTECTRQHTNEVAYPLKMPAKGSMTALRDDFSVCDPHAWHVPRKNGKPCYTDAVMQYHRFELLDDDFDMSYLCRQRRNATQVTQYPQLLNRLPTALCASHVEYEPTYAWDNTTPRFDNEVEPFAPDELPPTLRIFHGAMQGHPLQPLEMDWEYSAPGTW